MHNDVSLSCCGSDRQPVKTPIYRHSRDLSLSLKAAHELHAITINGNTAFMAPIPPAYQVSGRYVVSAVDHTAVSGDDTETPRTRRKINRHNQRGE